MIRQWASGALVWMMFMSVSCPGLASLTCMRIERLRHVVEPGLEKQVASYLEGKYSSNVGTIRELSDTYLIAALSDDEVCPHRACDFHLVYAKLGEIREVIAFRGSGWFLIISGSFDMTYRERTYTRMIFEQLGQDNITIGIPQGGQVPFLGVSSNTLTKLPRCPDEK